MNGNVGTRTTAAVLASVLFAAGLPVSAQEAVRLEPIAVSGDAAPGVAGATFAEMDAAWMNRSGQVAFWARLAGEGVTDVTDQSVWVAGSGGLVQVVAAGDAAPGANGRPLTGIARVMLDDAGRVVTLGALDDGVSAYRDLPPPLFTLFRVDQAGAAAALIAGESAPPLSPAPLPDPANRQVPWILQPTASDSGVLAFDGYTDDGQQLSRWNELSGSIVVDGVTFQPRRASTSVIGPGGHVVFREELRTSTGAVTSQALMLDRPGEADLLLVFGDEPAGSLPSVVFADVSRQIAVNAAGDVLFRARVRGEEGSEGVWVLQESAVLPVAQQGESVPGGAAGEVFGRFVGGPAMNLHGDVVIGAIAEADDGSTRRPGLWCFPADEAAWEVARSGDAAPVAADAEYVHLTDATVTEAGRAVFVAGVRGPSLGQFTQTALIVRSRDGGAVLGRTGAEMTLNGVPGVVRQISFAGGRNPDGSRQVRSYGAADQIAFEVMLEDGRTALLRATVGLAADLDHDGAVNALDLLVYLDHWFAGALRAELTGSAPVDVFDLLAYLDCWFAGVEGGDCL